MNIANVKIQREFYNKLPMDKIKISFNKNPIAMQLFLSFLTIEVERSYDHLGDSTGWTLLENKEIKLKIKGGKVGGIELLDSLEYGEKLGNPYNNYVNPFYLFDILTTEGRQFFLNYYATEIDSILEGVLSCIKSLEAQLLSKRQLQDEIMSEVKLLMSSCATEVIKQYSSK